MFYWTSYAVFYYKHEPDYPRLGKRTSYSDDKLQGEGSNAQLMLSDPAFSNLNRRGIFTQGSLGVPRLGRRNLDSDKRGVFTQANGGYIRMGKRDDPWNDKRGVFTQGQIGSPRIGRQGASDIWSDGVNQVLQKMAEFKEDNDEEKAGQGQMDVGNDVLLQPTSIPYLFIEMDTDNDGKLSKEEFVSGIQIVKSQTSYF
ncbi:hypothetical protein Bpfe_003138 [Biomphalaria pfeifferi]|uniref:EF-hand domain-containing protein n=1 Tax=Biomphalaria pfeifferi TaxID=112525 RepID=A0AAD8C700_BIOPF|nr:hypothetical protein Bpfe_003138 [Biomphalaria pfeifferi]